MALVCNLAEEFTTCVEIKDCGNAHGAEEANKESLSPLFNLVNPFVHGENNRKAAEQEDEDGNKNESVDRDNITMREAVPGANSTVPDEDGNVEEHVDGGLEGIVFRLEAEPIACWVVNSAQIGESCEETYSQVKTLPAMKHARTSSLPSIPSVPTMKS